MALWIVSTPIGTLGDLSPRAKEVLRTADLIAAEDTRVVGKLLAAFNIERPKLVSTNAHSEQGKCEWLAEQAGMSEVALVCDAGTPAISDPGGLVVQACHRAGVEIRSVPGPSALPAALAASGFNAIPSVFLGFAPKKSREKWTISTLTRPETLVIYEAPTRIVDLCERLAKVAPDREACLCREISKRYEELLRLPLHRLVEVLRERERIRGEIVLVIGPVTHKTQVAAPILDEGANLKAIAAALASRWGVSKREAYAKLMAVEKTNES